MLFLTSPCSNHATGNDDQELVGCSNFKLYQCLKHTVKWHFCKKELRELEKNQKCEVSGENAFNFL